MKEGEKKAELSFPIKAIKELRSKICAIALILGAVVSSFFLFLGQVSVARGFLLGTCFSIINFTLLGSFLPFSWRKGRKSASAISLGSILIRYMVLAIPIIVAIKSSSFELISTVVGIFSVQISIFSYYVLRPIIEKRLFFLGE